MLRKVSRNRFTFILLVGLLSASAAWADDVGYIDCSAHPGNTQVLAKAAKTDEVIAALPCGERFTVVLTSFFFSRIQTQDGKVGYVLTSSISHDTSITSVSQGAPSPAAQPQMAPLAPAKAARSGNPFAAIADALHPKQSQGLRVPAPPTPAPTPAPAPAPASSVNATAQTTPAPSTQSQGITQPTATTRAPVANANFSDKSAVIVQSEAATTSQAPSTTAQPSAASGTIKVGVGETFVMPQQSAPATTVDAKTQPAPTPAVQPATPPAPSAASNVVFPAKSAVVVQADKNSNAAAQRKANELAADAALAKAIADTNAAGAAATKTAKQPLTKPAQPASVSAPPAAATVAAKSNVVVQPEVNAPAQPATTATQTPAAAPAPQVSVSVNASTFPDKSAVIVQPEEPSSRAASIAPAQPEPSPAPAEPAPAPIQPAAFQPPSGGVLGNRGSDRRSQPLIELFGGFAFARMDNGAGSFSNLNGALGSFGWNAKSWLQVVADTSYNTVTTNGVKNVLYGNHYGPRFFLRGHRRWGATPFVEGLIGGSRADTTVTGTGGYTTSQNCISIKAGGGLDLKPSRHLEVRLIDVDYYRTDFGTNVQQSNYWVSAGIILRLFGGDGW